MPSTSLTFNPTSFSLLPLSFHTISCGGMCISVLAFSPCWAYTEFLRDSESKKGNSVKMFKIGIRMNSLLCLFTRSNSHWVLEKVAVKLQMWRKESSLIIIYCLLFSASFILSTLAWRGLAFRFCNVIFLTPSWTESCTQVLWHIAHCFQAHCVWRLTAVSFSFPPSRCPSVLILFLLPSVYILCPYVCVSMCVRVRARTHHLHACIRETRYYQCGSLVERKTEKWYPELRHQTPEASWVMAHRSTARTKGAMVKGMEMVEERDRWSRQKTSSPGSAANSVWGLRLWGLCQSGSGGKVAPLRKRVESEWERDARGCVGH